MTSYNYLHRLKLLEQQKQFTRMTAVVDNLESVVYEAHKTKGWKWVQEEPLWCTWTLERFGMFCSVNGPSPLNACRSNTYTRSSTRLPPVIVSNARICVGPS